MARRFGGRGNGYARRKPKRAGAARRALAEGQTPQAAIRPVSEGD